ncbi:MAG TPA: hypothetical protein PKE64_27460 [Anaerolineae bacterium]|nr:hypothetical protein [Anaerolineae bacterium]
MNTNYASLYKDHRQARGEHVVWLQDIERVRAQNSQTLALLGQIEAVIRKYDADLQAYKARMSAYEIETQLDEELIRQQERLEDSPVSQQLAALRQQVEEELTSLHESAKRYQLLEAPYGERVAPLLAAVRDLI